MSTGTLLRPPDWTRDVRPWMRPLVNEEYRQSVWERLRANVVVIDSECWLWQRKRTPDGYGQISVKRTMVRVHAVAYAITAGPWPLDLQLDHLCRVRHCCNPAHLEPVTPQVNTQRGRIAEATRERYAALTHCKNGHPFDEANTYVFPNGNRKCRRCRADHAQRAKRAAR